MSVYEGPAFRVERRDGWDVVVHAPVAAVVAIDRHERLTLVRQHRVPVGADMLELPAGFVDPNESPLEAAQRELAEETGLHAGDWVELTTFFTSSGFTDESLHLFLATALSLGRPAPEADEDIRVERFALTELPSLIADCRDAKTLIGLLLLARYRHL